MYQNVSRNRNSRQCARHYRRGLIGLVLNKRLKKELCDALMIALGAAIIFIGASGTLAGMFKISENGAFETKNVMLLIFSLVGGTLIGSF